MTHDELLTKLETWPTGSTAHDYPSAIREAVPLMLSASAVIRQLRIDNALASLLHDYETATNQRIRVPRKTRDATLVIHDQGERT